MDPDPTRLLEAAGIETPPIGFYEVSDPTPFEPLAEPTRCQFACYKDSLGERACASPRAKPPAGAAATGSAAWSSRPARTSPAP